MTATTVHLVSLGCARNDVDSEELAARLELGGFQLVEDPSDADEGAIEGEALPLTA